MATTTRSPGVVRFAIAAAYRRTAAAASRCVHAPPPACSATRRSPLQDRRPMRTASLLGALLRSRADRSLRRHHHRRGGWELGIHYSLLWRSRYLAASGTTLLAAFLTYAFWSQISPSVSLIFFVAVLFSSWYGGLRPGLLCAVLSTIAWMWIFDPTMRSTRWMAGTSEPSGSIRGSQILATVSRSAKP